MHAFLWSVPVRSCRIPFIVAINILIAVVSDFESAVRTFGTTWVSAEGVLLNGGWIQNRAYTLAQRCMFCQVCPMFAKDSIFAVQSVNNPEINLVLFIIALTASVPALGYVIYRSKKLGKNPYTNEIFVGTKSYENAMARREDHE